ncbi:hypothetical protein pb186bvf_000360 [Paramecium bursaria]
MQINLTISILQVIEMQIIINFPHINNQIYKKFIIESDFGVQSR